jgi:hypothetical protein
MPPNTEQNKEGLGCRVEGARAELKLAARR